jgi:FHA domain-containing protein
MAETTMPAMRVTRPLPGDDDDPEVSAPMPLTPLVAPTPPAHARMPTTLPPAAPAAPVAPVTAGPAAAPDALWAAFCEGAGIQMKLPQGLNPEQMRMIGQVLRHSVDGTLKLVAVRAAAKQELRAQVTTIQSRNNNPLKFSPDAGAAIEQLLQPPMRGFMVGPQAVNDVMDDLLGHAIGTMAGMRAALEGVLSRFEPGQLENKLGAGGMMDTLLPMNRRAKLWELYLQHFKRIQGDAEEDFHELFGKAFVRAYEDQLDRLDSARHPDV